MFEELDKKLQAAIRERGWTDPTPVQKLAAPVILKGEDVLVLAPTGIGKTESAMLPIFSMWASTRPAPISILYITPLRALNRDLFKRLKWWAERLELDLTVRHGDTTQYERSKQSAFPAHMFITTPETLQAMLTAPKLREALKNLKWVVVDEIHELVESKRGTQLSVGLARLRKLAGKFQTVGLSATVGSPERVAEFIAPTARIVNAAASKYFGIEVISPTPSPEDKAVAEKLYIGADVAARLHAIKDLITKHKSTLVFTNTRESAEVLSSRLTKMDKTWTHDIHHSSLSKEVRIKAEDSLKAESVKALICTSSLELGIDVGSIDLVVQHTSPRQVSKLVQRVGRSGHRIGEKSKGVIVAGDADDILESAVIARRALAGELEPTEIYPMPLDVMANQIVGMALESYDQNPDEMYALFRNAYPYRNLDRETFDAVLAYVADLNMVWRDAAVLRRRKKAWEYYYSNLSTIPDIYQYHVVNNLDQSHVGVLDETFVAEHGNTGTTFIVKGTPWRILSVYEGRVLVEPVDDMTSAVPAWEGELIPVPFEIAQEVGALRRMIAEAMKSGEKEGDVIERIRHRYPLSEGAASKLVSYIGEQLKAGAVVPDDRTVVLEGLRSDASKYLKPDGFQNDKDFVVMHACFGAMVNATLARFFAVLLSSQFGHSIAIKNDPYRIIFQGVDKGAIEALIKENSADELHDVILKTLGLTQMFRWRLVHVAKRFGAVTRRAKWDKLNLKKMVDAFADTPVSEEAKNEVLFEKLDVQKTKEMFTEVKAGEVKLVTANAISPIGRRGIEYQFRELVGPKRPDKEIFEVFRERLLGTQVRLVCMKCGDFATNKLVRDVREDPECPKCASRMLAVIKPFARESEILIKKSAEGKKLSAEDALRLSKLQDTADLVLTYGRRAVVCLAGRGVGPDTTIRVLAKQRADENGMLRDVLDAERQFAITKKFWS
ncbi:MAG: DEAD/DEAH box helicase [Candidatus Aenigmatarchaeota archaeon]|nr:MAG: DEAD/DEAH box helicase [Candidatus Aenigmarchaeota archaeon]